MTKPDLYAQTNALIQTLNDKGYSQWAERLHEAIAAGATGTEILMALRWHLSQFTDELAEVQRAVGRLFKATGRALR